MSSVLSSFVLSSSCSDISANLLLLNQLETHGMKQLEWLANRGDIVDGSFVDPALLQVWLDKILPDLVELTEAMRFQADNISVYRLAEMQIDIARAQTNEHFMQALLLELTNDLDHEDSYSDPDLFALERLRDTAEEI